MSEKILAALDPQQRAVATELEAPVVVLAGAGTGKTRAITHRIAYAAAVGRYDSAKTLAVTFTTRAAGEMRARLVQLGVRRVQARTIHAAALRQCQFFWPQVYRSEFPAVLEQPFGFIARAAGRTLGDLDKAQIRDLMTEIGWARASNITPERYATLSRPPVAEASPSQIGAIMLAYEHAKAAAQVVDFDDILLSAIALLSKFPQVAQQVRDTYQHFVVDEYQDISQVQHQLVKLWLGDRTDLCVVGDPLQAIHGFAGADPRLLRGFAAQLPNAVTLRLSQNYRSTPEILSVTNTLVRSTSQHLRAARASGEKPSFVRSSSDAAEATEVAAWLQQRREAGTPWREMAVLYRINAQSVALESALAAAGVPYVVHGAERFYERGEVKQALRLLQQYAAEEPQAVVTEQLEPIKKLLAWREQAPSATGKAREEWESIQALVEVISGKAHGEPALSLSQLVEWLLERAAWGVAPVAGAVTLATMHSAKGLEWDDVAVIGVREGLVPYVLCQEEPALSEERRLLYVALTRARQNLRVSWVAQRGMGRSRFLAGISQAEHRAAIPAKSGRKKLACRVCGTVLTTATQRKLGRHETCESAADDALVAALRQWRSERAKTDSVPAFVVFTDATLLAIAEAEPKTRSELLRISGIGAVKVERYGSDCLAIVSQHLARRDE